MTSYIPYNEPQFRQGSGAVTQAIGNNTTRFATTAFVQNELARNTHATTIIVKNNANSLLGEFSSIASAVNSITDSSPSKPYNVMVSSGIFTEPLIDLSAKTNISIVGSGSIMATIIEPDGNHDVISMGANCEISFCTIRNAPTGKVGILINDIGSFAQMHKISMFDNDTHIKIISNTQNTQAYLEYVDLNGDYVIGLDCIAQNSFICDVNTENFYCFPTTANTTHNVRCDGQGVDLNILTAGIIGFGSDIGVLVKNQAITSINTTYIKDCDVGCQCQDGGLLDVINVTLNNMTTNIYVPNIGTTPFIEILSTNFDEQATNDILIQNSSTLGVVNGFLNTNKFTNNSNNIAINYTDYNNKSFNVLGDLKVGRTNSTLTDITDLNMASGMGLLTGGVLSVNTGLSLNITAGSGYALVSDFPNKAIIKISWNTQNFTLTANQENFIYFNNLGTLTASTSLPDLEDIVYLGRVITNASSIVFIDSNQMSMNHLGNDLSEWIRETFGSLYISGSLVTENTTALHLNVSAGYYRLAENKYNPSGGTNITFSNFYRNGSGSWTIQGSQTALPIKYDNNSGTLQNLTILHYAKHALYVVGSGSNEKYFLVISQAEYNGLANAQNASIPLAPSYFNQGCVPIASIIVREGSSNIIQIDDIRPRPLSASTATSGGVTVHDDLTGRDSASNHPWALDRNGSNAMLADLNMGTFAITNVGTINSVNIASHASRHKHGGADEIATETPVGSGIPKAQAGGNLHIDWLPTITINKGGHGQITKTAGFDALSPLTTKGDILTHDGTNNVRLPVAPNTYRILGSYPAIGGTTVNYFTLGNLVIPAREYWYYEDFTGGTTAGENNWLVVSNGAGAGVTIATQPLVSKKRHGVMTMSTGTTNAGRCTYHNGLTNFVLGTDNGYFIFDCIFYVPVLSNATDEFTIEIGLGDNSGATADQSNGVYLQYNRLVSTNWLMVNSNTGVRTTTPSSVAVETANWHWFRMVIDGTVPQVDFYLDTVLIGSIPTNLPLDVSDVMGFLFKIRKTAGTTARLMHVDSCYQWHYRTNFLSNGAN